MNGRARCCGTGWSSFRASIAWSATTARGNGLSDRGAEDLSLDAFVQDLECVTGTIADERFDLVGISQGALFASPSPPGIPKG